MPLITAGDQATSPPLERPATHQRSQSQHSLIAKSVLMSKASASGPDVRGYFPENFNRSRSLDFAVSPPKSTPAGDSVGSPVSDDGTHLLPDSKPAPRSHMTVGRDGVGAALSDTPLPSTQNSPRLHPMRTNSGSSTPRIRPTTLDIPGLTRSKVSPDGRIAQRDVGSKLVIVMVGLPARGKSYITKKLARYLNWLQHDTKIFNVGERRRTAAGNRSRTSTGGLIPPSAALGGTQTTNGSTNHDQSNPPESVPAIVCSGDESISPTDAPPLSLPSSVLSPESIAERLGTAQLEARFPDLVHPSSPGELHGAQTLDQPAEFFNPNNWRAALIREQCALDTLDELLNYILLQGGSVGILDATNSTLERRKLIMNKIQERAGKEINVLFVESVCKDETLLESNMRLKLSGPDYKDKDPVSALEDFKKRVAIYEQNYVPLGDYEEANHMPYVKMIDVGRKVISHRIKGFLSAQAVYYLLNFNLSPRCIFISRHGESLDNVAGRIGGDADLSPNGRRYAQAVGRFIDYERKEWDIRQEDKAANTHFPPHPGDRTPPNPHYNSDEDLGKNFCVWTSMLKRSIQSGEFFNEEDYEVKQMRMLDELNAGIMEGMTYEEIRTTHEDEYNQRRRDKLQYRYPGPGGEGYLDIINRLRPVIVELERMTDHCLLLTHRSVARVLLAYFLGLSRDDVASLDAPLGMLYRLEPKPYGVEFKAFRYNSEKDAFDYLPDFKLQREPTHPVA